MKTKLATISEFNTVSTKQYAEQVQKEYDLLMQQTAEGYQKIFVRNAEYEQMQIKNAQQMVNCAASQLKLKIQAFELQMVKDCVPTEEQAKFIVDLLNEVKVQSKDNRYFADLQAQTPTPLISDEEIAAIKQKRSEIKPAVPAVFVTLKAPQIPLLDNETPRKKYYKV